MFIHCYRSIDLHNRRRELISGDAAPDHQVSTHRLYLVLATTVGDPRPTGDAPHLVRFNSYSFNCVILFRWTKSVISSVRGNYFLKSHLARALDFFFWI